MATGSTAINPII